MEEQLKELLPFLRDRNVQVRQLALSNLVSQTPKGSAHRNIFFSGQSGGLKKPSESDVIRDLKLLCRDQLVVAHDAFKALVNLSDTPMLISSLSEPSFLEFIVSYMINPQSICADLAAMLLSNLSASSSACATLLSMKVTVIENEKVQNGFFATQSRSGSCPAPVPYPVGEEQEILALPLLLDAFVQGAQVDEVQELSKRARKGSLHFLASVFGNLTSSPQGREFFLTPRPWNTLKPGSNLEYPLAKLVSFTEHKDIIRRGGVMSVVKNCAFNARAHRAILSPETEHVAVPPSTIKGPGSGALPYILLPLAGPEEIDLEDQEKLHPSLQFLPPEKTREPDSTLRLTLVETLLLLSHTRWGRDFLRANGVYEIVKAAHEVESVDKISEHIERLVTLIKGDEPSQGPPEEEEFELAATQEIKSTYSSTKQDEDGEEDGPAIGPLVTDEDDGDDKIEEI